MSLTLYNTLTRRKEPFAPLDPANVRMYVCGPTVYDHAHIGNARPVIVFDVLYRLLRHLYGREHVTYARNITDVDDKIIARAREDFPDLPMNEAIRRITTETERQFHEDVAALGCLMPEQVNKPGQPPVFIEPRATDYVRRDDGTLDMITLIQRLIERGCAYEAQGHVLFDVAKMPDYGRLARRSLDEMIAGARVEVAPYKRNPMDFVLWKPSSGQEARSAEGATGTNRDDEPGWDSPWGRGRPGWHIECSAMAAALLGETFDIHGGGIDLVFPHHENEIAQSRCAFHTDSMAQVWMHNGYLQVEGQKMAKSLGNFVTIRELLQTDKFGGRRWPGEVLRLAMLKTHYRQPIDFSVRALEEAASNIRSWYGVTGKPKAMLTVTPDDSIVDALYDDLNTWKLFVGLEELARDARQRGTTERFLESAQFLGFLLPENYFVEGRVFASGEEVLIDQRIADRNAARAKRDFAEADRIRDELAQMGIKLKDNPDGTTTPEIAR